jgi:cytoskeletal protein CcmA (bactofilin family)
MASLEGKNINDTYDGLLKTITNGVLNGDVITDGKGFCSALRLGRSGNSSTFDSNLNTTQSFVAGNNITADNNLCVKNNATIDNDITVNGKTIINNITASDFRFNGSGVFDNEILFNNGIKVIGDSNLAGTSINGNLSANGNLTVSGTISGEGDIIAFTSSDSRLKDNLIPIDSQNYVNNLTGYEFDWNERSKRSGKGKGIIAQHLYQIDKSLVHETNEGYLTVDYIGLIPVLIEEVKRLGKEIEELKK